MLNMSLPGHLGRIFRLFIQRSCSSGVQNKSENSYDATDPLTVFFSFFFLVAF